MDPILDQTGPFGKVIYYLGRKIWSMRYHMRHLSSISPFIVDLTVSFIICFLFIVDLEVRM